jgi:hypothetical protein
MTAGALEVAREAVVKEVVVQEGETAEEGPAEAEKAEAATEAAGAAEDMVAVKGEERESVKQETEGWEVA